MATDMAKVTATELVVMVTTLTATEVSSSMVTIRNLTLTAIMVKLMDMVMQATTTLTAQLVMASVLVSEQACTALALLASTTTTLPSLQSAMDLDLLVCPLDTPVAPMALDPMVSVQLATEIFSYHSVKLV